MFQDHGAVGRIPYLAPVQWEDGWPVWGDDGKVPETLDIPAVAQETAIRLLVFSPSLFDICRIGRRRLVLPCWIHP